MGWAFWNLREGKYFWCGKKKEHLCKGNFRGEKSTGLELQNKKISTYQYTTKPQTLFSCDGFRLCKTAWKNGPLRHFLMESKDRPFESSVNHKTDLFDFAYAPIFLDVFMFKDVLTFPCEAFSPNFHPFFPYPNGRGKSPFTQKCLSHIYCYPLLLPSVLSCYFWCFSVHHIQFSHMPYLPHIPTPELSCAWYKSICGNEWHFRFMSI